MLIQEIPTGLRVDSDTIPVWTPPGEYTRSSGRQGVAVHYWAELPAVHDTGKIWLLTVAPNAERGAWRDPRHACGLMLKHKVNGFIADGLIFNFSARSVEQGQQLVFDYACGAGIGAGGWPLVQAEGKERHLICPRCCSSDVVLTWQGAGEGTGPGGRYRFGDPCQDLNICNTCGYRTNTRTRYPK